MSKNIVFEGWLTKSPPSKRIWRTKWRRRWFALRQSGELPGQYFLDYYADRNCRRLKGTINLDLCEQVDAGLHMERTGNGALDPKLRGSVFTIQTQSRTYHLEADCEAEMEKWVDAICRVCGLRATDGSPEDIEASPNMDPERSVITTEPTAAADSNGPYIPIFECRTGVRAQNSQRAFTFDVEDIVSSNRGPLEKVGDHGDYPLYASQPQMRLHNTDVSENESNQSEDDCKSLSASHQNIRNYSVAKSFTKLSIKNTPNDGPEEGPPVPPRPPKTLTLHRDKFQLHPPPKNVEKATIEDAVQTSAGQDLRVFRRVSQAAGWQIPTDHVGICGDNPDCLTTQYWNLAMPPAVDRALKPRSSSYSISSSTSPCSGKQIMVQVIHKDGIRPDTLQYLDLDLSNPQTSPIEAKNIRKRVEIAHGKSFSATDADSAYKTVDFLKTEAFNITRQDAEASRGNH